MYTSLYLIKTKKVTDYKDIFAFDILEILEFYSRIRTRQFQRYFCLHRKAYD